MGQYNASVGQFATTSAGCLPHHHVLSGPQEVTKRIHRGEKFQPGGNEVYPIQPQILGQIPAELCQFNLLVQLSLKKVEMLTCENRSAKMITDELILRSIYKLS